MNKYALISVYNKDGLIKLANTLLNYHYTILSTGGTAKYLKQNNFIMKCLEFQNKKLLIMKFYLMKLKNLIIISKNILL